MTRIADKLAALAAEDRAALVPYLCIGDPDLETSRQTLLAVAEAGADIIEVGVPFSDPIADGSVIQEASQRALAAGSSLPAVLDLVESVRGETDVPIVLFGYYNPFFRFGEVELARRAAAAGVDGILCTDLPPEEAAGWVEACDEADVDRIFLLAPTSDASRIEAVRAVASGFVYFVSVTGVTGARAQAPQGIDGLVSAVREGTGLPVGVGFGIATDEQAAGVARYADLVIVGSALVRTIEAAGRERAAEAAAEFVGGLARAVRGARQS